VCSTTYRIGCRSSPHRHTSTCYRSAEFALRPVAAQALAVGPPPRRLAPGIMGRTLTVWTRQLEIAVLITSVASLVSGFLLMWIPGLADDDAGAGGPGSAAAGHREAIGLRSTRMPGPDRGGCWSGGDRKRRREPSRALASAATVVAASDTEQRFWRLGRPVRLRGYDERVQIASLRGGG